HVYKTKNRLLKTGKDIAVGF
ncbi:hypothetical protein EVA_22045, partial [gut metagenome]